MRIQRFNENQDQQHPQHLWKDKPPVPSPQNWDKILGHIEYAYHKVGTSDMNDDWMKDILISIGNIAKGSSSGYGTGTYK